MFPVKMCGQRTQLGGLYPLGKKITIRYQELSTYGVPRLPIGIAIRDYE